MELVCTFAPNARRSLSQRHSTAESDLAAALRLFSITHIANEFLIAEARDPPPKDRIWNHILRGNVLFELFPEPAATMQSRYPLLKKWTPEEHGRLAAMAEEGRRPDEIAAALNRSEAAVRVRAWQHGIALRLITSKRSK